MSRVTLESALRILRAHAEQRLHCDTTRRLIAQTEAALRQHGCIAVYPDGLGQTPRRT